MKLRFAPLVAVAVLAGAAVASRPQDRGKKVVSKDVVANVLNNNEFEIPGKAAKEEDRIQVIDNGLEFKDIQLKVKGDSVKPGDVVVQLAPRLVIELNKVPFSVAIECESNLLEGEKKLEIAAKCKLSGSYTFDPGFNGKNRGGLDLLEAVFDEITIRQLPGWGGLVKTALNKHLAKQLRENKEFKKKISEKLEEALTKFARE